MAVEKAGKAARANVVSVILKGTTIPHEIIGQCGASSVFMKPAAPGTGIIAGASARAVLELMGVRDVLSKAYGSTNPVNLVKATFDAVTRLRNKQQVSALRGVEIK
jgi:small subunit ribosomal protein S5